MCFSAEASIGVAIALIPVGAYCVETAWRKDRHYLPLAAVPFLFGLQQLCEARVRMALSTWDADLARVPSLGFLFFALVLWPVWVPLAVIAIESRQRNRWMFVLLALAGVVFGLAYYLPLAVADGRGLNPAVIGHSVRYDFSIVPAAAEWIWLALYLGVVTVPLLASQERLLRPLGVGVAVAAIAAFAGFEYAFASVWCFFAAILSGYLSYILWRLPESLSTPVAVA